MRQIKHDMRNLKHIKALFLSQKPDEGKENVFQESEGK